MRRLIMAGAAMLIAGALAACGTGTSGSSGSSNGTLTIDDETGQQWNCSFNPFNPSNTGNGTTFGQVYEPLAYVDTLENAKVTPWLATKWAWSNGNKTLTFTIRKGVQFSDGTPMSAADVAFTFNLLKKNKGLDLNSVWSVLSSVKRDGDTVVFHFKAPAVPYFYYIADQTPIVPEHIWSKVSNPVSYNDSKPVGTGAFTVSSCTPQNIAYTANKKYYQPGEPKIAKVNFPAFTSNNTANTYLTTDQAQWGSQFIPNINKAYANKPGHKYWFPPIANVSLIPNLTVPGLSDVKVRQAMAYAIDRDKAASVGEYGEEPGASQTDIATPTFRSWKDTADSAKYDDYAYNPARAKKILEADGYKLGKDGIFAKNGKKLSFTVMNVGGYSDWVSSMSVIVSELKAVGIQVTPENLSSNDQMTNMMTGKFQLSYYDQTAGPTPEYELRQWLYSGNTAPIGKQASTNWERYSNPATDKLFAEYAATASTARQHQIVDQLQRVMLSDVPVIPVTQEVDWFQYNTSAFTGWPTKSDPYALPAIYAYPDLGQVLLHLKPAS